MGTDLNRKKIGYYVMDLLSDNEKNILEEKINSDKKMQITLEAFQEAVHDKKESDVNTDHIWDKLKPELDKNQDNIVSFQEKQKSRKLFPIISTIAACFALFFIIRISFFTPKTGATKQHFRLYSMKGDVLLNKKSVPTSTMNKGVLVSASDVIQTGSGKSLCRLTTSDGTSISLSPDTRIKIEVIDSHKNTLLLKQGTILCKVKPQNKKSYFRVNSEIAQVNVLGTVFSVTVNDKKTSVFVKQGRVTFNRRLTIKKIPIKQNTYFDASILARQASTIHVSQNESSTIYMMQNKILNNIISKKVKKLHKKMDFIKKLNSYIDTIKKSSTKLQGISLKPIIKKHTTKNKIIKRTVIKTIKKVKPVLKKKINIRGRIFLQNGSILIGNIIYQSKTIVKIKTKRGVFNIEKNRIRKILYQ